MGLWRINVKRFSYKEASKTVMLSQRSKAGILIRAAHVFPRLLQMEKMKIWGYKETYFTITTNTNLENLNEATLML